MNLCLAVEKPWNNSRKENVGRLLTRETWQYFIREYTVNLPQRKLKGKYRHFVPIFLVFSCGSYWPLSRACYCHAAMSIPSKTSHSEQRSGALSRQTRCSAGLHRRGWLPTPKGYFRRHTAVARRKPYEERPGSSVGASPGTAPLNMDHGVDYWLLVFTRPMVSYRG